VYNNGVATSTIVSVYATPTVETDTVLFSATSYSYSYSTSVTSTVGSDGTTTYTYYIIETAYTTVGILTATTATTPAYVKTVATLMYKVLYQVCTPIITTIKSIITGTVHSLTLSQTNTTISTILGITSSTTATKVPAVALLAPLGAAIVARRKKSVSTQ
jgi:Na+-transporting NADH:ubiquinone oxidoreductase subunit NqrB